MRWQKRARIVIAIFAVTFAIFVGFRFKRRIAPPALVSIVRTDPKAVVESTGGKVMRFSRGREDVRVEYERQLTYADGSTRLVGVTVVTEDRGGGRTFTIKGKEGEVGQNESVVTLNGAVRLAASDGLTVKTEHATYTDKDGIVRAPGPVEFSHDRLSGSGVGMTYDKNADVLTLVDSAVVREAPDGAGAGSEVSSGTATFMRRDRLVRFDRQMTARRVAQTIEADSAIAHLTPDQQRIDTLELHGQPKITGVNPSVGGLQGLTGRDMTLKYGAGGEALEHVVVVGDAAIQLAGEAGDAGRQIKANSIDIGLAPDGSTPEALAARDGVTVTFPAAPGGVARTIRAASLDSTGKPGRGLTRARFGGGVEYRERGPDIDRAANSGTLDAVLQPGMAAIEEARFAHAVRFRERTMAALAAAARYDLGRGVLELSGTEPAARVPHVSTDRIEVDATRIEVTLAGPKVAATGEVKSVLQPPGKDSATAGRMPSMLTQDQPVNVTANELAYDGPASKATYTGMVQLWQGSKSVRADSIVIDDKSGDLAAAGSVATSTMLEQTDKNQQKERVRSVATARDFTYEEASRRATYAGDAHVTGPQGDLTAARIEMYLKPSGEELDRVEAYENVTLHEQSRVTTGTRLTYTSADERYVITGAPVKIVDDCGRETTGRTLTFVKATDTIDVDGNGYRTQTKGGSKCS